MSSDWLKRPASLPTICSCLARWVRRNSIKPEWAGAGILMNMVGPGIVQTPMTQALIDNKEMMVALQQQMPTPVGRFAQPEDVANVLIFLASPENSHMVGQMMYIDGGGEATVRGEKMWSFLDRLMNTALPRVRDFRGVSGNAFDGRGNYTLGLRDQLIFPEIEYDKIDKLRGMEVTIVTTAKNDDQARTMLQLLGMPFSKKEA